MKTVLDHYFINGNTIDEIAAIESLDRTSIVETLRKAGLTIAADASCDAATQAVLDKGYYSFQDFVQKTGLTPLKDQARELGVTRGALARAYDAFRGYLRSTTSPG